LDGHLISEKKLIGAQNKGLLFAYKLGQLA
jgi:hypothetical protein